MIGFSGSPRKGGNTDVLLDHALEGSRDAGARVQKVMLNDLHFRGCQECNDCFTTGKCILDDGMDTVYDLLKNLDVIFISSPIFFSGITSQTKRMIDRCQCLWARKYLLGRPSGNGKRRLGAFLSVGGRKRSDFTGALSTVKVFFTTINVEFAASLTYSGIDEKGAILNYPSALREARQLGEDLVKKAKALRQKG